MPYYKVFKTFKSCSVRNPKTSTCRIICLRVHLLVRVVIHSCKWDYWRPPKLRFCLDFFCAEGSVWLITAVIYGIPYHRRKSVEIERNYTKSHLEPRTRTELPARSFSCYAVKRWQLAQWIQFSKICLPPTQALRRLWCVADSQSFCQSEKPGVALGKGPQWQTSTAK